jgi:plastocyanin
VLRIHRDDSVTWRCEDADLSTEHDVTSVGGAHFQGSAAKMAGSYTVTFGATGTYAFECSIHPASMKGKVIVS